MSGLQNCIVKYVNILLYKLVLLLLLLLLLYYYYYYYCYLDRVLMGRPEGKRPLGIPRLRWEDSIKMDL